MYYYNSVIYSQLRASSIEGFHYMMLHRHTTSLAYVHKDISSITV